MGAGQVPAEAEASRCSEDMWGGRISKGIREGKMCPYLSSTHAHAHVHISTVKVLVPEFSLPEYPCLAKMFCQRKAKPR